MGEIKQYDESGTLFTGRGLMPSPQVAEIQLLKSGEYWIEDHECDRANKYCTVSNTVRAAAARYFGSGNFNTRHGAGIIAVLRKA